MTWATRVFNWMLNAPRELSAKDLEVRYHVQHPRRVLADLRAQGCIEESHRVGGERFWQVCANAPRPVDRRIDNARQRTHIALRARQLKRLARA